MREVLLVGAGGFIGAVARFGLSGTVQRLLPQAKFPYGTLSVNLIGCLIIGILAGFAETRKWIGPEARAFLMIGVLGGFTTFSAFALETLTLAKADDAFRAGANIVLSVVGCLALVWLGDAIARRFS